MKLNSLHDLYLAELQDLYDAENQIIKALPKMAEEASSTDLRTALEEHLEQSREHVRRLEQVFRMHGEEVKSEKCEGVRGIIEEGKDMLKKDAAPMVRDAAIIGAAQRVEHYEMAAYGCVRTYAEELGHTEAARLLQQTLNEEGEADKLLTSIAEKRNVEAIRTA
jgi:ferritin-like metal-binding protein YciE